MRIWTKTWINWADYQAIKTFKETYLFQQHTRKETIKNLNKEK